MNIQVDKLKISKSMIISLSEKELEKKENNLKRT